jgi:hypothetical protein
MVEHFLLRDENSVTRERIFVSRFEFDVRMAAARAEVPIALGIADVDRHGYDVILQNIDDDELDRKMQLKTRADGTETCSWNVFKRFFRPRMLEAAHLRIVPTPESIGLGGGIVVMDITDLNDGKISYLYTDYLIVTAFDQALIERVHPTGQPGRPPDPSWKKARAVLAKLERNIEENQRDNPKYDHKRISIHEDLFVRPKSPDHLLGLMGIRNAIDASYMWPSNFLHHYEVPTIDGRIDPTAKPNEHLAAVGTAAHALLAFTEDDLRTQIPLPRTAP